MYYKLAQLTLGVMLKIVFRPWAEGARNVPRRGPAIMASNHLSFADHFFGPLPLRGKTANAPGTAARNARKPGLKARTADPARAKVAP